MRVAVIGGGIAGLAAAHELLARRVSPVVYEAADTPGGKVGSVLDRGYLTENGPHFLARPLDPLLDRAGLSAEVVRAEGPATRWVHVDGRALKAPSLGLLARLGLPRAMLEPLFARPLRGDEPLLDLMVARLGRRAGELVARVLAAGVYAGDPARLSARDAFPAIGALAERGSLLAGALLRRGPRTARTPLWSLRRGLGSLAEAAAAKLAGSVRLGVEVTGLEPFPGGWTVRTDRSAERYDAAVIAVPARAASRLLGPVSPRFADLAAAIRAARVTLVHLGFAASELPRGFGLLDADGALCGLGTLFPSSTLPGRAPEGRALATAIVGGASHPERATLPDAELVDLVVADLRRLLGVRGGPDYVRIVRHGEAIPQYAPGHRDRVRAAREALRGLPPIAIAGASWDGVGVADVAKSGATAAEQIAPSA